MSERAIPVTRSSMPPFEEYCEEIRELWDTRWLTNRGAKCRALEERLRDYLGVDCANLFVNGHAALECVLEAMDLEGEVITTPFTFASTTNAIVRKGLAPVFCDIKPDDYTMDPSKIEELVTERTCAILPVHVYGNVCDVDAIQAVADRYGLKVIYDAAHAFGVRKDGVPVGRFGDASMFSLHATKVYNAVEGGLICHSDEALSERLVQWANFGITGSETVGYAGGNAKMNEFAASMGLCNLRHVDEQIAMRKVAAERYWSELEGIPGVRVCRPAAGITPNYAYMPVLFDPDEFGATRDDVFAALANEGIGARKYFYPLMNESDYFKGGFTSKGTPVAKCVARNVLTLPLYADLGVEVVDEICAIVANVAKV